MNLSDCFNLGYISKVTNNDSRVVIKLDTDKPENYKKLESVLVQMNSSEQTPVPFFVKKIISLRGNELTLELDFTNFQIEPTSLKGKSIYLPLDQLPDLGEKSFYYHEIIGFEVTDTTKGTLGCVINVYESAAHPVLAIQKGEKEILVPAIDDILKEVDKKNKKLLIEAPEGLIDLYLD